jgi:hypothetical protein
VTDRASERYEVQVVAISGWRAWRNAAVALVLSTGGPAGPASTLWVQVVDRATGKVVYRDRQTHDTTGAAAMRDTLQVDLDAVRPEEFLDTWGAGP